MEVGLVVLPGANEASVEKVVHGPDGVEATLFGPPAEGDYIAHVFDARLFGTVMPIFSR
jgi:hypothetical protein